VEEGIPLIRIEKEEEEMRLMTHLTQGRAKPNAMRVF